MPEPRPITAIAGPSPFDGKCPCCLHHFELAELKHMAVGDGWQRYIWIVDPSGDEHGRRLVSFDEFAPDRMTVWAPAPSPGGGGV